MAAKTKKNYWYSVTYKNNSGVVSESSGGIKAYNPGKATLFVEEITKNMGEISTLSLYDLKEGGELGEMVLQISKSGAHRNEPVVIDQKSAIKDSCYEVYKSPHNPEWR